MIVINCHSTYLTNHRTLNSKKFMVLSCAFIRFCCDRPIIYVFFLPFFTRICFISSDIFWKISRSVIIIITKIDSFFNGRETIHLKCLSPVNYHLPTVRHKNTETKKKKTTTTGNFESSLNAIQC